jgi:hypothetical protein
MPSPCLFMNLLHQEDVPAKLVMLYVTAQLLASKMIISCRHSCFCGMLSSSSPLLLGHTILPYVYVKSVYFSLTAVIFLLAFSIHVSIFSVGDGPKCLLASITVFLYILYHIEFET